MNHKYNKKKLEIYIHIPFCVKKCAYCDFLSFTVGKDSHTINEKMQRYCTALIHEIDAFFSSEKYRQGGYMVSTVFIGGGTPSLLPGELIVELLSHIPKTDGIEITIEANPGTLDRNKLAAYQKAGINRLSMGVQSFDDDLLNRLGRIHTCKEFQESYTLARAAGFKNMNLDLMSGLPGQTDSQWRDTLAQAVRLQPEHISAYSLIVEPGTPFFEKYHSHPELLPTEDETADMYEYTGQFLKEHGYQQYEISNYAKPGRECKHNLGYWYRTSYIGFGLGASSLFQETRFSNTEDWEIYMKQWEKQGTPFFSGKQNILVQNPYHREVQHLSVKEQMTEFMILGLRCRRGVSRQVFLKQFGIDVDSIYGDIIHQYKSMGFLMEQDGWLCLADKAVLVSNAILQDFM